MRRICEEMFIESSFFIRLNFTWQFSKMHPSRGNDKFLITLNLVPRVFSLSNMAAAGEDPGTERTKTIADWCILLRVHTCALIGVFLPKQKWWLPGFFVETENRVKWIGCLFDLLLNPAVLLEVTEKK